MGVAGKALSHEVTPTPSPASVTFISLYTRRVNKHFLRAGSGGGVGGVWGAQSDGLFLKRSVRLAAVVQRCAGYCK